MKQIPFAQLLRETLEGVQPLSYYQVQGFSNLGPEELRALRSAWKDAPLERRRQVAQAMAQLTEDSVDLNLRDVLFLCLDDPDEEVRATAIDGLSDDESISLLERLMQLAVEDPAVAVRNQALLALGRFAYLAETADSLADYRPALLRLLLGVYNDRRVPLELRRRSLEAVSYLSGSEYVASAISRAYQEEAREMRVSAVHAMGHTMADCWLPAVQRELTSPDPEMRYEAAYACGEMADPELVLHLQPLVEDPDHEVARAAIWALGEIGGTQARRLLERVLQGEDDDLRDAAEDALYTLRFFEDPMGVL